MLSFLVCNRMPIYTHLRLCHFQFLHVGAGHRYRLHPVQNSWLMISSCRKSLPTMIIPDKKQCSRFYADRRNCEKSHFTFQSVYAVFIKWCANKPFLCVCVNDYRLDKRPIPVAFFICGSSAISLGRPMYSKCCPIMPLCFSRQPPLMRCTYQKVCTSKMVNTIWQVTVRKISQKVCDTIDGRNWVIRPCPHLFRSRTGL